MSVKKALLVLLVLTGAVFAQSKPDPVDDVRRHDQELQAMLKRYKSTDKAQQDTLKSLINGMFSFQELGKRALGKTWATLKKPDQDSFVAVFRKMVENSSIKRLESYRADSTQYSVATGTGDKTVVTAMVFNRGKSSKVVYKLFLEGTNWKAWDLILDDVSSLRSYRDQFSSIVGKEGFEGLMKRLRKNSGA
jgi:phospholipid transport system substrate-binding protein